MRFPYYKRYPSDFFGGCIGMTFEQKAAYALVLDLIFEYDGKLLEDDRFIAGVLSLSVRRWNSLKRDLVLFGKLQIIDGFIHNRRATNEMIIRRKVAAKNRENASRSRNFKVLQ